MTAQVIFFPIKFNQTQENLAQLKLIQEQLHFSRVELRFQYRKLPIWQLQLAIMRYHHGFRDRWVLIENGIQKPLNSVYNPDDAS